MRLTTARILDRSVLLLGTVGIAAKQYGFPADSVWVGGDRPYLPLALVGLVGIFGALTPFEGLSRRNRTQKRVTVRDQILSSFGQLLDLSNATLRQPLEVSDLGLHVWRKGRSLRHPLQGELSRVATFRMGATPATRSLRPTRGVGVVGICWELNREVSVNVEELRNRLMDEARFDEFRAAHGDRQVMGFSWAEFQHFSHRGAVFASPIRNARSSFVGCVSFDAARGYDQLNCHRLWHELNSLCAMLGPDGITSV